MSFSSVNSNKSKNEEIKRLRSIFLGENLNKNKPIKSDFNKSIKYENEIKYDNNFMSNSEESENEDDPYVKTLLGKANKVFEKQKEEIRLGEVKLEYKIKELNNIKEQEEVKMNNKIKILKKQYNDDLKKLEQEFMDKKRNLRKKFEENVNSVQDKFERTINERVDQLTEDLQKQLSMSRNIKNDYHRRQYSLNSSDNSIELKSNSKPKSKQNLNQKTNQKTKTKRYEDSIVKTYADISSSSSEQEVPTKEKNVPERIQKIITKMNTLEDKYKNLVPQTSISSMTDSSYKKIINQPIKQKDTVTLPKNHRRVVSMIDSDSD